MGKQAHKIKKFASTHSDNRGIFAAKKVLERVTKKQIKNQKRTKVVREFDEPTKRYKIVGKVERKGHAPVTRKMLK